MTKNNKSGQQPYRWVKITDHAAFAPRDGAGALVFDGKMWLLGGWNPLEKDRHFFPRICNNEVWNSLDGRDWNLVKPGTFGTDAFDPVNDWEGRHCAGYAVFKDMMWIVCGDCNQKYFQYDIWNSTDGKKWRMVNAGKKPPWMPRVLHHTVVFKDAIWVFGGQTLVGSFIEDDTPEVFYNDTWRSTDGVEWENIESQGGIWEPRGQIGGAAVFQDRIWIIGGGTYDTPKTPERKFFNDVWSSPDGAHWTCHLRKAPWHARQYHDVAVFDNRLWVLEGFHKACGNRNDVWCSSDGVNWTELPDTPWKPRHAVSVFVYQNALWMVAGNNMESDVWRLERTSLKAGEKPC